ncbi:hypothetical protein [Desulfopila aestuarii]|uniref:Uncharacterized protein n=1 Tax=Desulfopila aestuarii DSM 18488 TaxID=1121416 RepID=A0A1M7YK66_9BACT|nr:hypothetical protein [Desulfopila aestuarii]SHO52997.1 hypothetical protein SAMN02745220_04878 [Desulfopila aestuarii DSM 18488]
MLERYQKTKRLDPFAEHEFDPELQKFIDSYPVPGLSDGFVEQAAQILSLTDGYDLSQVMAKIGRFTRMALRGVLGCPVYTIVWKPGELTFRDDLFFIDHLSGDEGDLAASGIASRPFQIAGYGSQYAVVAVDSEFVVIESEVPDDERSGELTTDLKMVAWQFYVALGIEHICIVLVTDSRLTQNALIRQFLANALPDLMTVYQPRHISHRLCQIPVTRVYLAAHFSLIEGGIILPSYDTITKIDPQGEEYSFRRPVITCEGKEWRDRTWIRERREVEPMVWIDGAWVTEESLQRRTAMRRRSQKRSAK